MIIKKKIKLSTFAAMVFLLGIFVLECVLFKGYIQREVAWSPFLNGDANWYLGHSYVFFDYLMENYAVPPGYFEAPHGIMLFFASSLSYLLLGISRVICLSANLFSFILWQGFVFFMVRHMTKSWIFAFSILGLCMAVNLPFQINKPLPMLNIQEYQRELVVAFLFGIFIVTVLFSDTFLKFKWAIIAGLVAGLVVTFRYVMLFHMVGIYPSIITLFFVMWMLARKRKLDRVAEYRARTVNSILSFLTMGAVCCYFIYRARVIMFGHYFVGTLVGEKDATLFELYVAGGTKLLEQISYYPRCVSTFLGQRFAIASLVLGALMLIFMITSLILQRKKTNTRSFNPIKLFKSYQHNSSTLMYNKSCFLVFLIACIIIPLFILSVYPLRSGNMAALITAPGVLVVAFIFLMFFNKFNITGTKPLFVIQILMTVATLSIGIFHQKDSYAIVSISSQNRSDYLEVARMYDDIVELSRASGIKEPGISVNFSENYVLGCCEAITAYWYERAHELFRVRPLLGGDIASPVEKQKALNTIKGSDIVLLSVHEEPMDYDPLKSDPLTPILAKRPFVESMKDIREDVAKCVKTNFSKKEQYQIFNRTVELYMNNSLRFRPVSILASSQLDAKYSADKILDASSPIWHSEGNPSYPQWLEFEYKKPVVIDNITIQCQVGAPKRAPSDFHFQGQHENGQWLNLLSVRSATFKAGDELKSWPVENVDAFKSYRLYITKNNGADQVLTIKQISFGYGGNQDM